MISYNICAMAAPFRVILTLVTLDLFLQQVGRLTAWSRCKRYVGYQDDRNGMQGGTYPVPCIRPRDEVADLAPQISSTTRLNRAHGLRGY